MSLTCIRLNTNGFSNVWLLFGVFFFHETHSQFGLHWSSEVWGFDYYVIIFLVIWIHKQTPVVDSLLQTRSSGRGGGGCQTGALFLRLSPAKQTLPLSASLSLILSLPLYSSLPPSLSPHHKRTYPRDCARPCTLLSVYAPFTETTIDYGSKEKNFRPVGDIISTSFHQARALALVF